MHKSVLTFLLSSTIEIKDISYNLNPNERMLWYLYRYAEINTPDDVMTKRRVANALGLNYDRLIRSNNLLYKNLLDTPFFRRTKTLKYITYSLRELRFSAEDKALTGSGSYVEITNSNINHLEVMLEDLLFSSNVEFEGEIYSVDSDFKIILLYMYNEFRKVGKDGLYFESWNSIYMNAINKKLPKVIKKGCNVKDTLLRLGIVEYGDTYQKGKYNLHVASLRDIKKLNFY